MTLLPIFGDADEQRPQHSRLAPKLKALADQGVYFGTSSWKYPGWVGSIYSPDRYVTRGKFSQAKFDAGCLPEYSDTFPAVCFDGSFYSFPSPETFARLFMATPNRFLFGFKVPEDVTVAQFPTHARYGAKAGKVNPGFLDAGVFTALFAEPLKRYADRVGVLIFEFGQFGKREFKTPDAFLDRLAPFLAALPSGFRYAVEIRNEDYLGPRYFETLASHNVAHVLSAWTRMPELGDQFAMPGVETADFSVVRALLAKGMAYEQAVQTFSPYEKVQEPNEGARRALRDIAAGAIRQKKSAFLFVNNRLEGNAPTTIEAVVESLG